MSGLDELRAIAERANKGRTYPVRHFIVPADKFVALLAVVDAAEKYLDADNNWIHIKQTDHLIECYDVLMAAIENLKNG